VNHFAHCLERFVFAVGCCALLMVAGCALQTPSGADLFYPPPPPLGPSVLIVPQQDQDLVWEQMVDVVDDVFKIQDERRVQLIGDVLTEGTLNTYPRGSSTLFEWHGNDVLTTYDKLESTLQTMRQFCDVRVSPAFDQGGFQIEITVRKELEDLGRPHVVAPSQSDLRHDMAMRRVTQPVGQARDSLGWIPKGRNVALEQELLTEIAARLGGTPVVPQPAPDVPLAQREKKLVR
jgi:hypothetical protein